MPLPEFRQYPQATSLLSTDAFVIDRLAQGTMWIEGIGGADVILTVTGGPPSASQFLGGERIERQVTFPAGFAGSGGLVPGTAAGATFVVSVTQNGVQVGTCTCSTGGVWTFATTGNSQVTFNVGDQLRFVAPAAPDLHIADFGITLLGTLGATA